VTKRAPTHGGGVQGRAISQHEGVPQEDFEEITDRIDLLTSRPPKPEVKMSSDDLGKLLASFEADLCRLNGSLTKESRANRSTLKDFSTEVEKTKKSVDELNSELNVVVRREVG
jgi:hypothetical protein